MPEEDLGWVGTWEPNIISPEMLAVLRQHAGAPVMGSRGKPIQLCVINLRTGDFQYPPSR